MNGGIGKDKTEFVIDISDKESMEIRSFLKEICGRFNQKDKYKRARLYTKQGIELTTDDLPFMKDADVLYVGLEGENFNNCAILDDYDIGEVVGEGGFGQVFLGKIKSNGNKVAIKFMDVSEYRKFSTSTRPSKDLAVKPSGRVTGWTAPNQFCSAERLRSAGDLQRGHQPEKVAAQKHRRAA